MSTVDQLTLVGATFHSHKSHSASTESVSRSTSTPFENPQASLNASTSNESLSHDAHRHAMRSTKRMASLNCNSFTGFPLSTVGQDATPSLNMTFSDESSPDEHGARDPISLTHSSHSVKHRKTPKRRPNVGRKPQSMRASVRSRAAKHKKACRSAWRPKLRRRYLLDDGREGTVQFIGQTSFAKGLWVGLVLGHDAEGNTNGTVFGRKYFTCKHAKGLFVRCARLRQEVPAPIGG